MKFLLVLAVVAIVLAFTAMAGLTVETCTDAACTRCTSGGSSINGNCFSMSGFSALVSCSSDGAYYTTRGYSNAYCAGTPVSPADTERTGCRKAGSSYSNVHCSGGPAPEPQYTPSPGVSPLPPVTTNKKRKCDDDRCSVNCRARDISMGECQALSGQAAGWSAMYACCSSGVFIVNWNENDSCSGIATSSVRLGSPNVCHAGLPGSGSMLYTCTPASSGLCDFLSGSHVNTPGGGSSSTPGGGGGSGGSGGGTSGNGPSDESDGSGKSKANHAYVAAIVFGLAVIGGVVGFIGFVYVKSQKSQNAASSETPHVKAVEPQDTTDDTHLDSMEAPLTTVA